MRSPVAQVPLTKAALGMNRNVSLLTLQSLEAAWSGMFSEVIGSTRKTRMIMKQGNCVLPFFLVGLEKGDKLVCFLSRSCEARVDTPSRHGACGAAGTCEGNTCPIKCYRTHVCFEMYVNTHEEVNPTTARKRVTALVRRTCHAAQASRPSCWM